MISPIPTSGQSNRSTNNFSLTPKTWKLDLRMLLHYQLQVINKPRTHTGQHTCTHSLQMIPQFSKTRLQYPNESRFQRLEHGFIKESTLKECKLNGNQEAFGFIPKEFPLKSFSMGNCLHFEEEETLLQSMGRDMGVLVDTEMSLLTCIRGNH